MQLDKLAVLIAQNLAKISTARWIKLDAAARYSSIGTKKLKQLAKDDKIVGFKDPDSGRGDWIIDRNSLDDYRLSQHISKTDINNKALDAMKRLGYGA